jgi:hypothetical protein
MLSKKLLVAPLAIFVLITLATLALRFAPDSWSGWKPATCLPNNCFCEVQRDGFIRQPSNTYSDLAYVLVGLLVLAIAQSDWTRGEHRNLMQTQRTYPILFGIAVIAIGVGSFFYHASLAFVGQWFDLMGMYLFASFALLYNYARLRPLRNTTYAIAYAVIN